MLSKCIVYHLQMVCGRAGRYSLSIYTMFESTSLLIPPRLLPNGACRALFLYLMIIKLALIKLRILFYYSAIFFLWEPFYYYYITSYYQYKYKTFNEIFLPGTELNGVWCDNRLSCTYKKMNFYPSIDIIICIYTLKCVVLPHSKILQFNYYL